jgi:hypothetical protein
VFRLGSTDFIVLPDNCFSLAVVTGDEPANSWKRLGTHDVQRRLMKEAGGRKAGLVVRSVIYGILITLEQVNK